MNLSKKITAYRVTDKRRCVGCLLLFSAFLNKVIVYTSENNDTEERELVIGSQKPGMYVIS